MKTKKIQLKTDKINPPFCFFAKRRIFFLTIGFLYVILKLRQGAAPIKQNCKPRGKGKTPIIKNAIPL